MENKRYDDKLFYSEKRTDQVTATDRKHYTQMTTEEKEHCARLLQGSLIVRESFVFSAHAKEKIGQFIDMPKLYNSIGDSNFFKDFILEYSTKFYQGVPSYKTLLIEYPELVEHKGFSCRLCLVVDVQLGKIVTAFYNQHDDNHAELDTSIYDSSLRILPKQYK
ncbi:hypothetical protein [Staphylococcus phage vB_SsapH-Golestan-100]|nr:hypothetical protein [Staphylococcus phage vB_SsapH-Golestan-100]